MFGEIGNKLNTGELETNPKGSPNPNNPDGIVVPNESHTSKKKKKKLCPNCRLKRG